MEALENSGGNQGAAARDLNISRAILWRKKSGTAYPELFNLSSFFQ